MKVHRDYSSCVWSNRTSQYHQLPVERDDVAHMVLGLQDLKSVQILYASTTDPKILDFLCGDPDGIGLYKLRR